MKFVGHYQKKTFLAVQQRNVLRSKYKTLLNPFLELLSFHKQWYIGLCHFNVMYADKVKP